jgi:DMSO/TMAO reductase YedYZ heme-binding membrane subunit
MMLLSTAMWDVTRASAFVAFVCYTVSVAWGISLTARSFRPPVAPQFDYHRFVGVLGFSALLVHVGTLMFDQYANVDPVTLVGGGGASMAVRAGVVAMWLALALPISFQLKQRFKLISQKFWRRFHYFGYAVWALALVHGIAEGTDSGSYYAIAAYGSSAALIGGVAWWRWLEAPPKRRPRPTVERPTEA